MKLRYDRVRSVWECRVTRYNENIVGYNGTFLDSLSPELQKKFEQNDPKLMEYISQIPTASPQSDTDVEKSAGGSQQ